MFLSGLELIDYLSGLDGVDQWASIKEEKEKSPHQFVIHNVDKDPLHNTWQVGFMFCLFVHKIRHSGCYHLQPVEADMGPGKNTKFGREPSFLLIFHQNNLTCISHHP